MNLIKRFLPVVLVAVLATGGYWLYQTRSASQVAATTTSGLTQIVEVKQGSLSTSLSVVGQLAAVQQADLAFERLSGTAKLLTLQVKAGNTVTAGQVLATIDPAPYQQAVDQAKSSL